MKFSLAADKFREETKLSRCFVGVQGEREREKRMKRSRENREKGQLRINRRFRAKITKASKSFSFWQAVAAQAEVC